MMQPGLPGNERELAQLTQSLGQEDRGYFNGLKAPLSVLVGQIKSVLDRPFVDRTGTTEGLFNYRIGFSRLLAPYASTRIVNPALTPSAPSMFTVLEEEAGLKLEATTTPMEVWVIERVERPTGN